MSDQRQDTGISHQQRQSGFTPVEVVLVMAIVLPILLAVLGTSDIVSRSTSTNQRSADTADSVRLTVDRLSKMLRPASLVSLRRFDAGTSTWVPLEDDVPCDRLSFQIVEALPSASNANLGPVRVLGFALDEKETKNGKDDNRNGLIDEGRIVLSEQARSAVTLARDIETFRIVKRGRLLQLELQSGKLDGRGRQVHRGQSITNLYLRNN